MVMNTPFQRPIMQQSAINSVKERGRVKQIYAALRSLGRGRRLYVLNYLSRRSPATAGRRRVKPIAFFARAIG